MTAKKNKGERATGGKIVGYCRVSTGKQANGLGAQQAAIESHATAEGKELVAVYVEQESGKDNDRAILGQAIERARDEGATLVIAKLDRLSRDVEFLFSLRRTGVDFLALDLPDFNTLTLSIFAGMAQHEREICSQRTKAGLAEARKHGRIGGNPNGWPALATQRSIEARKENALMNENNQRAKETVRLLISEGKSLRQIAAWLNQIGERTARGHSHTATSVQNLIKLYGLRPETATDTKGVKQ